MQKGDCIFHLDLGFCKPCSVDIRRPTKCVGKAVRAVVLLLLLSQKEGTGTTDNDNGNVYPFFGFCFSARLELSEVKTASTSFPVRG
jgi:hypothetical protein